MLDFFHELVNDVPQIPEIGSTGGMRSLGQRRQSDVLAGRQR